MSLSVLEIREGPAIPSIKAFQKVSVTHIMQHWHKKRQIDQSNNTVSPEADQIVLGDNMWQKCYFNPMGGKDVLLNKCCQHSLQSFLENSLSPCSCTIKINFKCIKVLNIKRNILGMRKTFSNKTGNPKVIRKRQTYLLH